VIQCRPDLKTFVERAATGSPEFFSVKAAISQFQKNGKPVRLVCSVKNQDLDFDA
jgi:hypothetical protein